MLDSWPARPPGGTAGNGQEPDPGLYTGLGGAMTALDIWAQASGDQQAGAAARALAARLSLIARAAQPVSRWRDPPGGGAGVPGGHHRPWAAVPGISRSTPATLTAAAETSVNGATRSAHDHQNQPSRK